MRSWIDYANLLVAVVLGIIGIAVAVRVSDSADRISRSNLLVTMASFLLDDSPKRQSAGVDMAQWAFARYPDEVPTWAKRLVGDAAKDATGTVGGAPLLAPSSAPAPSESPGRSESTGTGGTSASSSSEGSGAPAANRLFATLGGSFPRLFIQIASDGQRPVASELREGLGQTVLNGDPLVIPKIQKVPAEKSPHAYELRYLKSGDAQEAEDLTKLLGSKLHTRIVARDLSKQFGARSDIKPRTYE